VPAGAPPTRIGRPVGSVQELVGIWTGETSRVSYTTHLGGLNEYGAPTLWLQDSAGKGFGGVVLKIRPGGGYLFHFDYAYDGCQLVRDHEGSLSLSGGVLTLRPTGYLERQTKTRADARKCAPFENRTPPVIAYRMDVNENNGLYGYPGYRMTLDNAVVAEPNSLLMDRLEPAPLPLAQPLPRGFAVGNATAGGDLQGLWVAVDDSASSQGKSADQVYRADLRLLPGGRYEFRVQRPNALYSPLCTKDLQLVEKGTARFGLRTELGGLQEGGTLVLQPDTSLLSETVSRCGSDDFRRTVALPPAPRYFAPFWVRMKNGVTGARDASDEVGIRCPADRREQGAWQYLFCEDKAMVSGYHRR